MADINRPIKHMEHIGKYNQFSKKAKAEIADIDYDGYWNIILKNHDRCLSEKTWSDVKWEFLQMVKENDFTLHW